MHLPVLVRTNKNDMQIKKTCRLKALLLTLICVRCIIFIKYLGMNHFPGFIELGYVVYSYKRKIWRFCGFCVKNTRG